MGHCRGIDCNLLLVIHLRREAAAHCVFGNTDGDEELEQVIGAAGFAADPGHAVAAEGMTLNKGTGDFAVEVQVADFELVAGAAETGRAAAVDAAGERVFCSIRDLKRFIQILRTNDGQDRAEDFVLGQR